MTDAVAMILKKKGWFSQDQLTKDELIAELNRQYQRVQVESKNAMIWFNCEYKRRTV